MKALVADDELTGRLLLERVLRGEGCEVVSASNGCEAVERFERDVVELVVMDAQMPVMNGYDAARRIKELAGARFVPIIFVTGNDGDAELVRCLESGGDDFIAKPFSPTVLRARVRALQRQRLLHAALRQHNEELAEHRRNLIHEQQVAQRLFEKIVRSGDLDAGNIRYLVSSMSIFNGDLVLAARRPEGGQHVLVGDFTGHGLAASIGAIPVARIFESMTSRGFPLVRVLSEINQRLREVLPTGVFFAAAALELDHQTGGLSIWNGGIPDVLIRGREGIRRVVASRHLPLGIVSDAALGLDLELFDLEPGDRIFMYTDGLVETENQAGERFGEERLRGYIDAAGEARRVMPEIDAALRAFQGDWLQSDDITLLEIEYVPGFAPPSEPVRDTSAAPLRWSAELSLHADALRRVDPLAHLVALIGDLQGIPDQRQRLQAVLGELYTNALDHGVLGLDSSLKSSPEGFSEYYWRRTQRLATLADGWVRVRLEHAPQHGGGGVLRIEIEDSGAGFDHARELPSMEQNAGLCGRGIPLLRRLCRDLEFLGKGNVARAIYEWR
jgi:two-component system, HptB-dependent secretion and biofilm response regulator